MKEESKATGNRDRECHGRREEREKNVCVKKSRVRKCTGGERDGGGRIPRARKRKEKTRRREEEKERQRERERERWKVCETFNRRVAGSPEEYPAEREALEKPVGANLFYFEYKVGDEIFPAAVKMCVVDERADGPWRARARARRRREKIF